MNGRLASAPEVGSLAEATPQPSIPAGTLIVNTYRVERLLGAGGMGEVYLARHVQLGTWHAVKVIHPALFSNQQVLDLFLREGGVLRGVRHDAIVSYDGFFRDEAGRNYLVMEYVDGPSLSECLRGGPLSLEETLSLRDRLAEGLAAAHSKGAVHRDMSPDNVIIPEGKIERAKLIDFGLCKLTDPAQQTIVGSAFAGKLRFASPEQLGLFEGAVDARSDIYSFGLLLAAAATGRPLSMGTNYDAVLQARKSVPDLDAVPEPLREQIGAMLQPDPARRPADVLEIIRRWPVSGPGGTPLGGASGPTPHPNSSPVSPVDGRDFARRRLWFSVAIVALSAAVAGGYWLLRPSVTDDGGKAPPEVPPAIEQLAKQGWSETAPYFHDLVSRGRTDQAFALLEAMVGLGRKLPPDETYGFAQDLLGRGRSNEAFALFKVLAMAGDGPSAFALGKMYDPLLWAPAASPFSNPNPREAEQWYGRALEQGVDDARVNLELLRDWKADRTGEGEDVR